MDDIVIWFEREFSHLGFTLTPLTYNPFNFTPMRGIQYTTPQGRTIGLRVRLTPELTDDLRGNQTHETMRDEYRELIKQEMYREIETRRLPITWVKGFVDFTPTKKITKFKFNG